MRRRFKVTEARVDNWSTSFSIKDLDHSNPENSMGPEGFIHTLGRLAGRELKNIEGMEFIVILTAPSKQSQFKRDDPLDLCGKTIGGKPK